MYLHPANAIWEYLAIDLQPGELVLEVLNRHRDDGWEYESVDSATALATLRLKRKRSDVVSPASPINGRGEVSRYHPHARRWTIADDDIIRNHSAKDAARLLEVSIAT